MIMNSRAMLFQASNTTVLVSVIKDYTTFRVQDELSSNDSTALINILIVFTHTSVYVRHIQPLDVILCSNTA